MMIDSWFNTETPFTAFQSLNPQDSATVLSEFIKRLTTKTLIPTLLSQLPVLVSQIGTKNILEYNTSTVTGSALRVFDLLMTHQ